MSLLSGLLTNLEDQDSSVRSAAADALGRIESSTPKAISGLITALKDTDKYVRSSAAEALGGIKASTPEVISGLITSEELKPVRQKSSSIFTS
jgi:HEAT repeat protein